MVLRSAGTADRAPSLSEPAAVPRCPRLAEGLATAAGPRRVRSCVVGMRTITVLQVGDVHLPDHIAADADVKDDALGDDLVAAATAGQLQASTRALLAAMTERPEAVIVFTGDLTSRGDLGQYRDCVTTLIDAFALTSRPLERLHVVPGNHDVDRELAQHAPAGDLYHKFEPLRAAWSDQGLNVLAADLVRTAAVGDALFSVETHSVNSCLGCGERRQLPIMLRDGLVDRLTAEGVDEGVAATITSEVFDAYAETIDAPAFSEEHLQHVCEAIADAPATSTPVIVAHHNLVQQAQPRFDLYTDTINAGMFRSRLCSLGRTILYLHGHIHSDPIEVVAQEFPDRGTMVCISAPEFCDGFNRIDVTHSDSGLPLGCTITRYRVRLHGGVSVERPIRVAFHQERAPMSDLAVEVAVCLMQSPDCSTIRGLRGLSDDLAGVAEADLADAIEEVEWHGVIEVLNRERAPEKWRFTVVHRDG